MGKKGKNGGPAAQIKILRKIGCLDVKLSR
jgi:hypothetical protein